MGRVTQLIFLLFLSLPLYSLAALQAEQVIKSVCSRTHNPALCASTSTRFAKSYPVSRINAKAVLIMHLRATSKRARGAKNKATKLAGRYPLPIAAALKGCSRLYGNIIDLIGVSIRAIDANDGQSKVMVQISLQQVRQAIQQCDMSLKVLRGNNPLGRFDASLGKMSNNCDDLNNM